MPDVFISYAQPDRKRGEAIAEALAAQGFSIKRGLDASSPAEARAWLTESAAALACWSRAGVKSDAVFAAAAQGFNQGKLVAVQLQPTEPPEPYQLVHAIDLSAWRGGNADEAWRELASAVEAVAGHAPAPAVAAAQVAPAPTKIEQPAPVKPVSLFQARSGTSDATPIPERAEDGTPRTRVALIAVIVMALLIATLWAGPRVINALNKVAGGQRSLAAATRDDLPPAPVYPTSSSASSPLSSAQSADQDDPVALPASSPVPEISTPVVTPVGETAKKVAPSASDAAPSAGPIKPAGESKTADGDPGQVMANIESCLATLARECPNPDPALAAQLSADGKVSVAERRILETPLFPDRGLVTADNLKACKAAVKARSHAACPAIAAKSELPKPAETAPAKPPEQALTAPPL